MSDGPSPARPRRRYVRSPDILDTDYLVVSISLYPDELRAIDAEVQRRRAGGERRVNRSRLIAQAVKEMIR